VVHNPQIDNDLGQPDTIAAIATPPGFGGIGVIRISGEKSLDLVYLLTGLRPEPRRAVLCKFYDRHGDVVDEGIALYFPSPCSYTGEAVCELQCHGAPVVLNLVMQRLVELGARIAQPGEYTKRAFLNGKLDLSQAEAVADLINSSTEAAAKSAMRSLDGEFSAQVDSIIQRLVKLRVYVEAAIDFPEEEIDFLDDRKLMNQITDISTMLDHLLFRTAAGRLLRDGVSTAIAGLPNAGKSSLMNRLLGEDRVIVTPQAGTTRDTVDAHIDINGLAVRFIDTAGLRSSSDAVESQGISRAWDAINAADISLYVIDSSLGVTDDDRKNLRQLDPSTTVLVWNKIDLTGQIDPSPIDEFYCEAFVSALRGDGIEQIHSAIAAIFGFDADNTESTFIARRRHIAAIKSAHRFVDSAFHALDEQKAGELASQDLRDAMMELGKITQVPSSDELLGEIFSSFCIGK